MQRYSCSALLFGEKETPTLHFIKGLESTGTQEESIPYPTSVEKCHQQRCQRNGGGVWEGEKVLLSHWWLHPKEVTIYCVYVFVYVYICILYCTVMLQEGFLKTFHFIFIHISHIPFTAVATMHLYKAIFFWSSYHSYMYVYWKLHVCTEQIKYNKSSKEMLISFSF